MILPEERDISLAGLEHWEIVPPPSRAPRELGLKLGWHHQSEISYLLYFPVSELFERNRRCT